MSHIPQNARAVQLDLRRDLGCVLFAGARCPMQEKQFIVISATSFDSILFSVSTFLPSLLTLSRSQPKIHNSLVCSPVVRSSETYRPIDCHSSECNPARSASLQAPRRTYHVRLASTFKYAGQLTRSPQLLQVLRTCFRMTATWLRIVARC